MYAQKKKDLISAVNHLVTEEGLQRKIYDNAGKALTENHTIVSSTAAFKAIVDEALSSFRKRN